MDIGKFKASKARLTMWICVPPLLMAGIGLTSYALRLQSNWQLERTRELAQVLPRLADARNDAEALLSSFSDSESGSVASEDELISFLRNAAQEAGFTVDSLQVDRKTSAQGNVPVLRANVKGTGSFAAMKTFVSDVSSRQQLLSETSLQISMENRGLGEAICRVNIAFELVVFGQKRGGV